MQYTELNPECKLVLLHKYVKCSIWKPELLIDSPNATSYNIKHLTY